MKNLEHPEECQNIFWISLKCACAVTFPGLFM